jgi:hypothetical protein
VVPDLERIGLVIYFVWSSRNSRLAKGEEQAG